MRNYREGLRGTKSHGWPKYGPGTYTPTLPVIENSNDCTDNFAELSLYLDTGPESRHQY